ncbi:MAG: cupredoxin family copper-binding protein [Burkholderiaceae bacterium]
MNTANKSTEQWAGCVLLLALTLLPVAPGVMAAGSAQPEAKPGAQPAANVVQIANFRFSPPTLTVAAGTRVTWVNRDDEAHTVTSSADPRVFSSPPLDTGEQFSFTFAAPGSYSYFCAIHPQMVGVVIVK